MSNYSSCPNCGRNAKKAISSNFFPIYKCGSCNKAYCKQCGGNNCPGCGSSNSREVGKVYAQ